MNRWSKSGVLDSVFERWQREQVVRIKSEAVSLDSTIVKVHPDGTGAGKNGPPSIGKSRGGWSTKVPLVAADARTALTFALSPGEVSDAVAGRELLGGLGPLPAPLYLIMDRAYEDNATRQPAREFGWIPVAPPKSNRLEPWRYDKAMYCSATRLNACSGGSRASAVSSRASTNSTLCFLVSFTSP